MRRGGTQEVINQDRGREGRHRALLLSWCGLKTDLIRSWLLCDIPMQILAEDAKSQPDRPDLRCSGLGGGSAPVFGHTEAGTQASSVLE